jgi:hypothetical protein
MMLVCLFIDVDLKVFYWGLITSALYIFEYLAKEYFYRKKVYILNKNYFICLFINELGYNERKNVLEIYCRFSNFNLIIYFSFVSNLCICNFRIKLIIRNFLRI